MHTYRHVCLRTCICTYIHARTQTYFLITDTYMHAHMHTFIRIHANMNKCIYTYQRACCIYAYTWMQAFIQTCTHAYMHANIHSCNYVVVSAYMNTFAHVIKHT